MYEKEAISLQTSKRILVVPGDSVQISQDVVIDPQQILYLYKKDDNTFISTITALLDFENIDDKKKLRVIPLKGRYIPREGDIVIGIVVDVTLSSWIIDINSPYLSVLNASDYLGRSFNPLTDNIRKYLEIGDVVVGKIATFDRSRGPILTVQDKGLGKVVDGSLIEIEPIKVARVIGKKKSMLNMLIEQTKCDILVGNNGRIILRCPNPELEYIAILAIKKIESEAHTTGLTERIREFIIEEKVKRGLIKYEV
ncbi:exosome complex RNA-binding protein Rrp4 [Ignisphaera aggregans DSM 17230]|uniref:Exosome complex component Rrp4 n=1 Tax=Ignisphaera aggregans (strain DSM 17230 / JCM 13409 / AQ1.S1) TaxID=583356 RepID=RRP4_IGNAA|nr:RecName: Full=Exosome complex component Rrp4 [Ignisphaera aggregans DSM 17230]ADM28305.1 exosome complex RNA-binding protein Rrp4 [Ignisphaera aggregans DSM 17230]